MTTATETDEPMTDQSGEVFDAELHASKPDGSPALKTDGTFRKKRRDAGGARSSSSASRSTRSRSTPSAPAGVPRALKEQHQRHVKAIKDAAGIGLLIGGFASPIDAYTLEPLVDPFADALATVAQDNPQLAAAFDKLGGAGGMTTVLAIVGLATVQVLHNHDKIPEHVARMAGVKPKSEALAQMGAHAEQIKAAAAQRAAEDEAEQQWLKENGHA